MIKSTSSAGEAPEGGRFSKFEIALAALKAQLPPNLKWGMPPEWLGHTEAAVTVAGKKK